MIRYVPSRSLSVGGVSTSFLSGYVGFVEGVAVGVSTGESMISDASDDMKKTSSSSAEGKSEGNGKIALPLTQLVRRGLK